MSQRALTREETECLEAAGCRAQDWGRVLVGDGFDSRLVRNVSFRGSVEIGALGGEVAMDYGVSLPSELADATLIDCSLGDNVRVTRIHSHLVGYDVGDGAVITDVGRMATREGATFGNGVELEPLNEGGGRELPLFNELSSPIAYMLCVRRYRSDVVKRLLELVELAVGDVRSNRGRVGAGAVVAHVPELLDVAIGPGATIDGAQRLVNGTILSEEDAPSRIGDGVSAEDFIVSEGSSVEGGAVLSRTFVGQGVQVGKQFSSENSLFFSNSECFHGEACSVFGGPYTVTHHKSTLLIAGMYSFYNAGSGTNQSNHMYKLGPVHQGTLERGSKTGSFSYLLWPSAVGPFSVVIGKHTSNLDTRDLPFSYIMDEGGRSVIRPAANLSTVGTVRDGEKWPSRDRRKGSAKRDLIRFEVWSPYTVERMMRAETLLADLYANTPREREEVRYGGGVLKRLTLRRASRSYGDAVDRYLMGKILDRVGSGSLAEEEGSIYCESWVDIGGLLMARDRMSETEESITSGELGSVAEVSEHLQEAMEAYEGDEWAWVRRTFESRTGDSVDSLSAEDLDRLRAEYAKAEASFTLKVLADAELEFEETSRIGYGADGSDTEVKADFDSVRGRFEENSFVKQMKKKIGE